MLWIINGLVYGFFSALYTMVNQDRKFNGYILGIWRGYGIALVFLPFLFFLPVQTSAYNWFLLIFQGWLIGIYDSSVFCIGGFRRRADIPGYGRHSVGDDVFMVDFNAAFVSFFG